uniref:Uncharacterized protein n=1 Tax=Nelumbo nucifera TaxID=4432 RepID=A0A822ZX73_NELNU|nr:TPA_asm: hypothetical protein HUJ06_017892 [Nelumbo nucifera]
MFVYILTIHFQLPRCIDFHTKSSARCKMVIGSTFKGPATIDFCFSIDLMIPLWGKKFYPKLIGGRLFIHLATST